jgi:hypothetical protein
MFSRKFWFVLGVLIILSPLFAYAAELVGYSEPLENIAERLGVEENPIYEGILPDYSVPGLDMFSGTLISAVIGTLITMGVTFGVAKAISKDGG